VHKKPSGSEGNGASDSTRNLVISAGHQSLYYWDVETDRLCGLVVRVLGYRSRGPDSIPNTTRFYEK
jgi:hypothetical protein